MPIIIHGVRACTVPITFSCSAVASDLQDTNDTRTVTLCVNFPTSYFKKFFVSTLVWNLVMYEGWNFNSGNYLFTTDTK